MYRYVALSWNPRNPRSAPTIQSLRPLLTAAGREWSVAHEGPGLLVIHSGARQGSTEAYLLDNGAGVVLGKLFERRNEYRGKVPHRIGARESAAIVATAAQHLVDNYWGSYVCLVRDSATAKHHVVRDPSGGITCYHTQYRSVDVLFSHVESCVRLLGLHFPIDRSYLARWLIYSGRVSNDTGLENVKALGGGERLTLCDGASTRTLLWDPTSIAQRRCIERRDEAGDALRSSLQEVIDAWASCYHRITHKLSGGLDSAIVAGCLAAAPSRPQVTYLNLSIDVGFDQEHLYLPGIEQRTQDRLRAIAGHGDERYFARLVAERWGPRLIERQRNAAMDLRRLWSVPLSVTPALYFTVMDVDDIEIEIARTHGTQAFFSGQAGDSVLLATSQPFPAVDFAYLWALRRGLWRKILDTARLSKESVWTVMRQTIDHGLLRRRYSPPAKPLDWPTVVSTELKAGFTEDSFASDLAKLSADVGLPPGKQSHVRSLDGCAYQDYVFFSGDYADHIDPLNSQPVWEIALQIPTYTLLSGGVSRGLARHAFADLLPPEIRTRQVKGTGTPFYQHVARMNLRLLQDRLLGGHLVAEGYLDGRKLEGCLAADEPFAALPAGTLLSYLAAEIWLTKWQDVNREAVGVKSATV